MKIANRDSKHCVREMVPFDGNNLYGNFTGKHYVVYSYGRHFPLFANINGVWYENSDRYSVTTSKHKTQSRPIVETILVDTKVLKDLIEG